MEGMLDLMTQSSLTLIAVPFLCHFREYDAYENTTRLAGRLGSALVAATRLQTLELQGSDWPMMLRREVLLALSNKSNPPANLKRLCLDFKTMEEFQETIAFLPSIQLGSLRFCVYQKIPPQDLSNYLEEFRKALASSNTTLHSLEIWTDWGSERVALPAALTHILDRNRLLGPIRRGPLLRSNSILGAALAKVAVAAEGDHVKVPCIYELIRRKSTFLVNLTKGGVLSRPQHQRGRFDHDDGLDAPSNKYQTTCQSKTGKRSRESL